VRDLLQRSRRDDAVPPSDEVGRDVGAIVSAAVKSVVDAGKVSATTVADGAESAARALAQRVVGGRVARPRPVADRRELASALATPPSTNLLGNAVATAVAMKALKRLRPLAKLTKRSPMWLAVSALPAFTASVAHGSEELALVASHLAHRARDAGIDPDPHRVRRATVQLLTGLPVDPDLEPRHGTLAVLWLRRGVRASLPYAKGATTRDPKGLAAATAAVDPGLLGPQS